jgi:competence protein ComEC
MSAASMALRRARARFALATDVSFGERLGAWIKAERDARRPFLWLAPGMGIGSALYYAADVEPSAWAPLILLVLAAVAAFACRGTSRPLFAVFILISAVSAGFLAGRVRTVLVDAPVLQESRIGRIEGLVEEVDWRQQGARIIIRPDRLVGTRAADLPFRVRVTLTGRPLLAAGDRISATARLLPPPTPVMPGGYDFARDSYFNRIGGVGSLVGRIEILPKPELGLRLAFSTAVDRFRNALTLRIIEVIGGQSGAVAAALVTGKRGMIDDETNDALRSAGIYHVVSISGLHMAIAAGLVFWAVRFLLVLIPGVALHYPVKKWAALAAMLGATAYDIFAGSDVATERSLIMTLVFFGAIVVERRVMSMRNWTIAALILLTLEPNAIFGPGFQMSFAAVAALVALYERHPKPGQDARDIPKNPETRKGPRPGPLLRGVLWFKKAVVDVVLTTLAAEAATAPFSLYHFHMVQSFGLIGNAVTLPFVSLIVMPAAFLGVIALPFGLDAPIWSVMGHGVDGVLAVSRAIATWPSATRIYPAFGVEALVLLVFGLLTLALWISPIRYLGVLFAGLGVAMAVSTRQPDILVSREASIIAVRGADGRLAMAGRTLNSFTLTQWLRADGDARLTTDPGLRKGAVCDRSACALTLPDGRRVVLAYDVSAIERACRGDPVLVTARIAPGRSDCQSFVIDRGLMEKVGVVALVAEPDGQFRLISDHAPTRDRPWSRRRWQPEPPVAAPAGVERLTRPVEPEEAP